MHTIYKNWHKKKIGDYSDFWFIIESKIVIKINKKTFPGPDGFANDSFQTI